MNQTLTQSFLGALIRAENSVEISVVGVGVTRRWRRRDVEFEPESIDNRPRDLVLEREDPLKLALECFRPQRETFAAFGQLGSDADAIAISPNASLQDMIDV